jgi:hypothetical protein
MTQALFEEWDNPQGEIKPLIEPPPVYDNPCMNLYGKGPVGRQCKECSHMYQKQYDKVYWKCDLRKDTNGPGSDHRRRWPACARFEPITESESNNP